jgi:hypothetical protein
VPTHLLRRRPADVEEEPRSVALDLCAEAPETQRVIPIGADLLTILKSRPVRMALQADVTFVTTETTGGGWRHGEPLSSFVPSS